MNLQISWGEVFEEIDDSGDGRVTKDELKAQYLTTISTELGFPWDFVRLSLKTCSFYHEKLFIQKQPGS